MLQPDQIIRTRRRTIALIIQPDGRLVVRAPLHTTHAQIQAFIQLKAAWVLKKQSEINSTHAPSPVHQYEAGETFWFLGDTYPLQLVKQSRPPLALEAGAFRLASSARLRAPQVFTAWYRQQAQQVMAQRVAWFAGRYGFSYQKVRITSAQTRWGSCSALGVLNFPWRLVMAPMEIIDYVVVHELVHTQEHNHRAGFWQKVGAILPDYLRRRNWLKHREQTFTL
jgi:predicted metal-dependent hydrolase